MTTNNQANRETTLYNPVGSRMNDTEPQSTIESK